MTRNNKQMRMAAMLLFGLAIAAGPVYAQGDAPIMEQIDLTNQQREQIKTLTEQFVRETRELRSGISRLVAEEKLLKNAATPNEAALRAKMKARADMEIELSLALTRFHERVEKLLTPAQRLKLNELKAQNRR